MNTQCTILDSLEPSHRLAIELRLLGTTYSKIAENAQISVKENTIRTWFMDGGICHEGYQLRKKQVQEENDELIKDIHLQLRSIAVEAVQTIRQAVRNGNLTASLKALEMIGIAQLLSTSQNDPNQELLLYYRQLAHDLKSSLLANRNTQLGFDPKMKPEKGETKDEITYFS